MAYGISLGGDHEWVKKEWQRQKESGGIGQLPRQLLTPDERKEYDRRHPRSRPAGNKKQGNRP